MVVDENDEFLLHNPAAAILLGFRTGSDGAGPGRHGAYLPDGVTPYPHDQLPLIRALAGEPTDHAELIIRNPDRPDGVNLSVSGRPLHDHAGRRGAVAVFHDITHRKAAEAKIAATIAELREREADLRAFAGVAAHDLKAPLASVAGYAELLDDSLATGADPSALRPTTARIIAGVERMRRLIDDLLAYATARDGQLNLELVDLPALVADVVNERTAHLRAAGAGAFPDIHVGDLPALHADRAMIRQLFDNLIGNAIKYTLPGQTAHIAVTAHRRDDDDPGWVHLEIADRGIGIPAADQPHVFTSFHRAAQHRRDYTGTGLGLAICQRVVDRHGGQIGATDNPGGGTRIWFTLPTATAASVPASESAGSTAPTP